MATLAIASALLAFSATASASPTSSGGVAARPPASSSSKPAASTAWNKGSFDGNRVRWGTTPDKREVEVTKFKTPSTNMGMTSMASQRIPAGQGPYRVVIDRRFAPGSFKVGRVFNRPGTSTKSFGAHQPDKRNMAAWAPGNVTKTVNRDGSGRVVIRYKDMPESKKKP
ncbi:MAG TPA: hypothetical protein VM925_17505 [Labilithrix sp.]|nr:hypothetical protein [Labilithrix sp.]